MKTTTKRFQIPLRAIVNLRELKLFIKPMKMRGITTTCWRVAPYPKSVRVTLTSTATRAFMPSWLWNNLLSEQKTCFYDCFAPIPRVCPRLALYFGWKWVLDCKHPIHTKCFLEPRSAQSLRRWHPPQRRPHCPHRVMGLPHRTNLCG